MIGFHWNRQQWSGAGSFDQNGEKWKYHCWHKMGTCTEETFPNWPNTKFYKICDTCASTQIKLVPYKLGFKNHRKTKWKYENPLWLYFKKNCIDWTCHKKWIDACTYMNCLTILSQQWIFLIIDKIPLVCVLSKSSHAFSKKVLIPQEEGLR